MKLYLGLLVLSTTLAPLAHAKKFFVIYGEDNRLEVHQASPFQQRLARSTMSVIDQAEISRDPSRPGYIQLNQSTLTEWLNESAKSNVKALLTPSKRSATPGDINFCPGTRFVNQPNPSMCSGFLIAPDLAVTAGHCLELPNFCEDFKWVFDFHVDPMTGAAGENIPEDNVYNCKRVVSGALGMKEGLDYAVIQLDRKVTDREPLKISDERIADEAPLMVIGNPSGLPTKVADGARVRENLHPEFFNANLDTFQGNSGSAVFNAKTGVVEGILVRGEEDYVPNFKQWCIQANVCADDGCRGEDVSRMTSIPEVRVMRALRSAVKTGDRKALDEILALNTYLDFATADGRTALLEAAAEGQMGMIEALLRAGASAAASDAKDRTALHEVAAKANAEHASTILALIDAGASLEAKDANQETALMVAAKNLNLEGVKLLIKLGANVDATDAAGMNVLVPFMMKDDHQAVLELASLGVDPSSIMKIAPRKLRLKLKLRKVFKRAAR